MKLIFLIPLIIAACSGNVTPSFHPHAESADVEQQVDTVQIDKTEILNFTKQELLGQFDPSQHPDFVRIAAAHTTKENIYLRKAAYEAFVKMHQRAAQEGIRIVIISATRNFNDQKKIWENKWQRQQYRGWQEADKALDILKYSSMPGTSRHHWGTDVDFNSVSPSYFSSAEGKKLHDWLVKNAAEYGFVQTYTSKSEGRTGYEEEAWHWSYYPLSDPMLNAYNKQISYADIAGFSGSQSAAQIQVIEKYVNGVNTKRP